MSDAHEVLLDAIMTAHGYTRAEAEESARYVEHMAHVRNLLAHEPQQGLNNDDDLACVECGLGDHLHVDDCGVFLAWEALDHVLGHAAVAASWDDGARRSPFIGINYARYSRFYVSPAETVVVTTIENALGERFGIDNNGDLVRLASTPRGSGTWADIVDGVARRDLAAGELVSLDAEEWVRMV